jgi:dihydroxy-acid dehydratase
MLLVDETEMARRAAEWKGPSMLASRGYRSLYLRSVLQADQGVDFDFLREPERRGSVPR